MKREESLSSRLVVATAVVRAVAAGVGVQVLLPSTRRYYCCSNRSRCAGTTALYGAILLCEESRRCRHRRFGWCAYFIRPKNTHTHHLSVSLFIHSFIVEECITPLSVPRFSTFQSTQAIEREEPSSLRLVVATAVLLLLIEPPVSPLSDKGSFPPPLPPPCLNPMFHNRDSARAMERGAVIVASRGHCNSVAPAHRATYLTACGRRSISPSSSSSSSSLPEPDVPRQGQRYCCSV
ncbi:hypothetical protein B296_00043390 [Ensete ventricosum]|uniref:Uncharacterized protein n=1 Tax=Ensete ventricosum TaxID=4639 RepID=A0A426YQU5_ENSVE|nr:hypothetical protein B296_00043390 [Ensete ventricosum]